MNATAADYWVHNLSPFLLRFPESWPLIGGAGIRYYGLAYILGAVAGYYLLLQYYRKGRSPFNSDQLSVLILALMAGVLIGGRVGYVLFYGLQDFFHNPLSIFAVWQGGMASHGGFIGVAIAVILFSKKHKYPTLATGDLVVSAAVPGLFLGRLANFINGELWGRITEVPWAVIFPHGGWVPRHPSQLYEAFLEGLILFAFLQWRLWKSSILKRHPGRLSGEFLVGYSVFRFVCEFFREPDASLIAGLSRGQFYSLFTLLIGVCLIGFAIKSSEKVASIKA